jgi:hypothetical protein
VCPALSTTASRWAERRSPAASYSSLCRRGRSRAAASARWARVVKTDIVADNGVIHVIDSVVLPK